MEVETPKEISFKEILASSEQNGFDCGFLALNVSRQEIIDYLLQHQDSEYVRGQLAPEVQNFLFLECSELKNEEVLRQAAMFLLNTLDDDLQRNTPQRLKDINEADECLVKFSALLVMEQQNIIQTQAGVARLNEKIGNKEDPKPLNQLAYELEHHSDPQVVNLLSDILKSKEALEKEILEFASSKMAYLYYLENHYQKKGWMAFQRRFGETHTSSIIDIIADAKQWKLMVWMPIQREEPNILQCLYSTESATQGIDIAKEIHHIKFNGINHFTKLELIGSSSSFDDFWDPNVTFTGRVIPSILEGEFLEIEVNHKHEDLEMFEDIKVSCMDPDLMFEHSSSNFKKLVQSSVFVDKSLFIKRVLEHGRSWLITRPRRWGKTLNLRMLQTFLEKNEPQNSFYFKGGKHEGFTYRQLQIAKHTNIMDAFQGKYPVVFVTFKDVLVEVFDGTEMAQIKNKIKTQFREVFKSKGCLARSLQTPRDIERWDKIVSCKDDDLTNVLPFLAELLKEFHGQEVFFLVDEHDRCVNNLIQEKAFIQKNDAKISQLIRDTAKQISCILSPCVKDSSSYCRAIITGIYNAIITEPGSGINNLTHSGIEDYHFKQDFGLSKTEIDEHLLKPIFKMESQNKLDEKRIILKMMETHYNGYSMSGSSEEENLSIYVPFPVISFLLDIYTQKMIPVKPKSYWSASGSSEVIKNLSYIQSDEAAFNQLFQLSQGKHVLFQRNIQLLSLVGAFAEDSTTSLEELVFYLLINGGYVTRVQTKKDYFKIPNQEILEYFSEVVLTAWIQKKGVKIQASDLCKLGDVIGPNLNQIGNFEKALKSLLSQLHPGVKDEPEFQALIYGGVMDYAIYKPKDATHKASIEKYARNENNELGKIDTIFFPLKANVNLIIHEYKVYKTNMNEENIQKMREHAIWQILVRHYMEEGLNRRAYLSPFEKVELRGIVFFENDVNGRWDVSIKLVTLTIEEAKSVVEFFNNDQTKHLRNVFSNREDAPTREAKAQLLNACGVSDLDSLIERLKNSQSEHPKSDEMQIEDEESKKPDLKETLHALFKSQKIKVRKQTEMIQYIIRNKETLVQCSNAEFKNSIKDNISGVGLISVTHLDPIIDQIKQIIRGQNP